MSMGTESTPIVVMGSEQSLTVTTDPAIEYVTRGVRGTVHWVELTEYPQAGTAKDHPDAEPPVPPE